MADKIKYQGLCATCEHDPDCTLSRSNKLEIVQCEEFSNPQEASEITRELATLGDPSEAVRLGLCANCLQGVTCGFPNARQHVLQCEEYVLDEVAVTAPAQSERSKPAA